MSAASSSAATTHYTKSVATLEDEEERVPERASPTHTLVDAKSAAGGASEEQARRPELKTSNQDSESRDAASPVSSPPAATRLKDTLKRVQANDEGITELDLTDMSGAFFIKLKASGGALVARVMEVNHTVERLVLPDHDIGDSGALAMADMLRVNSTLRHLDLYGNGITDAGCKGIADALYGHDSLQHLALWGNAIGDEGAKALAQALQVNRSLTYVGLVGNNIGEAGAKALLEAVQLNPMIQTLGLAANPIPANLQSELKVALTANKAAAMTMGAAESDEESSSRVLPVAAPAQEPDVPDAAILYDSDASSDDESDTSTDGETHVAEQADEDDDDDEFWV
ncbi:hypothetical protein PybrP1_007681 [[Pythium] brassicae (nom. inval.)]|nr:hypothetical protein PybrP1_007681 [[Pythium] brassicae (nom. inval.)]